MTPTLKYFYNPFFIIERFLKFPKWVNYAAVFLLMAVAAMFSVKFKETIFCDSLLINKVTGICLETQSVSFWIEYVWIFLGYAQEIAVLFLIFKIFKLRLQLTELVSIVTWLRGYLGLLFLAIYYGFLNRDYFYDRNNLFLFIFAGAFFLIFYSVLFIAIKKRFQLPFLKIFIPYVIAIIIDTFIDYAANFWSFTGGILKM